MCFTNIFRFIGWIHLKLYKVAETIVCMMFYTCALIQIYDEIFIVSLDEETETIRFCPEHNISQKLLKVCTGRRCYCMSIDTIPQGGHIGKKTQKTIFFNYFFGVHIKYFEIFIFMNVSFDKLVLLFFIVWVKKKR